jgi:hypothetical protein
MSTNDVQILQRGLEDLRAEVHTWGNKIDVIHAAVVSMAGKTSVPGPSVWKRLMGWIGFVGLG